MALTGLAQWIIGAVDHSAFGHGAFDDAAHWEAALNGAVTDLLFGGPFEPAPLGASMGDAVQAAFDALLFGDRAATRVTPERISTHAWVANDDAAPAGFGRIMVGHQFEGLASGVLASDGLPGVLDPDNPLISANAAIASGHAANDNIVWVGSDDNGAAGVYGRDPSAAVLDNGDALVAWVGIDGAVHAHFIPAGGTAGTAQSRADGNALDAVLAGLNSAPDGNSGKAGRVSVTSTGSSAGHNSFAVFWTCEFALNSVLIGTILTMDVAVKATSGDDAGQTVSWMVQDIAPQTLPAGVTNISVAVLDTGTLQVTYSTELDDAAASGAHVTAVHWENTDASWALEPVSLTPAVSLQDGGADTAVSGHATPALSLVDPDARAAVTADPSGIVAETASATAAKPADSAGDGHHSDIPDAPGSISVVETVTIAGSADDTVQQTTPSLAVADDGAATVMHIVAGDQPDAPASVVITALDDHGHAKGPAIVVSDNAIVADAGQPQLDVGPAITGTGGGVAVAWVERGTASSGDAGLASSKSGANSEANSEAISEANSGSPDAAPDAPVQQLQIQVFDGDAKPLSTGPVVVATSTSAGVSFSDIATGYVHRAAPSTAESNPAAQNSSPIYLSAEKAAGIETADSRNAPADDFDADESAPDSAALNVSDGSSDAPAVSEDAAGTLGTVDPASVAAPAEPVEQPPAIGGDILAVAWIECADASGYGTLNTQLYAVVDPGVSTPSPDVAAEEHSQPQSAVDDNDDAHDGAMVCER